MVGLRPPCSVPGVTMFTQVALVRAGQFRRTYDHRPQGTMYILTAAGALQPDS